MVDLAVPHQRYYSSFLESHLEWDGKQQDGSGLRAGSDVETEDGFAAWVRHLLASERDAHAPEQPRCTYRWILHEEEYLGSILLRHRLTPALTHRGGHIGYGVRPSARRRGLASWGLRQILPIARNHNLDRVLATCYEDNTASWRTIESCGGVLEDVRTNDYGRRYRRYWIET